ncbi:hypothetical protein [Burkholderia vietnamiensis]|uniref:hypothetical protein n=1 Tax=Burkholderia vietnamiensis TaxID=60552 RepID=UPI0012D99420|nr:hypothetical protein [Burkholderia vietnamiensis]
MHTPKTHSKNFTVSTHSIPRKFKCKLTSDSEGYRIAVSEVFNSHQQAALLNNSIRLEFHAKDFVSNKKIYRRALLLDVIEELAAGRVYALDDASSYSDLSAAKDGSRASYRINRSSDASSIFHDDLSEFESDLNLIKTHL